MGPTDAIHRLVIAPTLVPTHGYVTANPAFSQDEGHPWLFNDGGHEVAKTMLEDLKDGKVEVHNAASPVAEA